MDKQQKLDYQRKIQEYMKKENLYDLFQDLTQSLVVRQPEDPIGFLIQKLSSPEGKKVFIVGPPGFKVRQFALQIADYYKFTTISVGDLLRKQVSKRQQLAEQIDPYFRNFTMVKDQVVISIVKKEIQSINKEKKSFILSGFPKTRSQALAMQREGIFPDAFIIMNMETSKVQNYCESKFKLNEKFIDKEVLANKTLQKSLIANHALEYNLNLKQVKEIYKNSYFEIDCNNSNREQILESIARLLKFKIKTRRPKRPASILITSGSKDKRKAVGKRLCQRYGFVYVSVYDLLRDQVSKNTEVGRLSLVKMRQGKLIEDNIVNGLVQSRLSQVDCQLQGFVLEGYPKTQGQIAALKDIYIQPSMIVLMEGGKQPATEILKQLNEKHEKTLTKLGAISEETAFQRVCFALENS